MLAPDITRRLVDAFAATGGPPSVPPTVLSRLTARETEVLTHLARGLSNAEIADALTLSEATVKTHVARILGKLGLTSRSQAVVLAYESRLVNPQ